MGYHITKLVALFSSLFAVVIESRLTTEKFRMLSAPLASIDGDADADEGTRWAVLIAGSNGYGNYRHQADVCHAYQILKAGGLRDKNIVVFMYDDIAYNEENPHPGVIINHPNGGRNITVNNVLAVILGNKTALTGGSGKVVSSNPQDHIFIYYTDHGGPGVLEMPNEEYLYANDFNKVLIAKHASGTYKSMVIYIEACESGSIFEGLLPEGLSICATTASNSTENSYATYCSSEDPRVPKEYTTCLGDLYSVAWMEDSDKQNRQKETLQQQYEVVKNRTANAKEYSSHAMQFGNLSLARDVLYLYMGASVGDGTYLDDDNAPSIAIEQRDADLLYLNRKWITAPEGSKEKDEAKRELDEEISRRRHVDQRIQTIVELLFGAQNGSHLQVLNTVRPVEQPLVDDWDCLKTMVGIYRANCGSLSTYGMKYMRALANICNAGVLEDQMAHASAQACS